MILLYFISLLSFFSHDSVSGDNGIQFLDKTYAEVLEMAKEQEKPIMLIFRIDSCPNCERMENDTYPNERVGRYFNENFLSLKINSMSVEGVRANRKYNVRTHPGIIFLDFEGNETHRAVGYRSPNALILEARKALGETVFQTR